MPIYNPPSSTGGTATAVPQVIASGVTYSVATNTQVPFFNPIIINAGGVLLTIGTGVLALVS